jgi:hypothetical protein
VTDILSHLTELAHVWRKERSAPIQLVDLNEAIEEIECLRDLLRRNAQAFAELSPTLSEESFEASQGRMMKGTKDAKESYHKLYSKSNQGQ